jgi:hypothetical protein
MSRSIKHMPQKRLARQAMQNLWHFGIHTLALAGSENNNIKQSAHTTKPSKLKDIILTLFVRKTGGKM